MTERTIVSRHDWLHGLVPCLQCGLPLAVDRDLVKRSATCLIRRLPRSMSRTVGAAHRSGSSSAT